MALKKGGKVAAAPAKKKLDKVVNPLFEKRPKQFGIGGALPPKKDLHRYMKWPKAIRIQRQRRILKQRLKVPPALNQFTKTLDKNLDTSLFKLLLKYRLEDKAAKKERLLKRAQAESEGKIVEAKKPIVVKYGLNHEDGDPLLHREREITFGIDCPPEDSLSLVQEDGDPLLHREREITDHQNQKNEDKLEFSKILEAIKANFNDKYDEYRKKWGGGIMGSKSQAKTKAKEKVLTKEVAQRMN
ncbi:hypothetical protein EZV62_005799 [Acer yangbiense]|uniref:60S ribosomal protein L7a n=1 Tax=Acer yangbiense TaxID=1000413 RepID=A0A5C7IPY5_9ROSI|nr:hypothetical protein EZV62_005799 [Acer yangbiense]